MHHKSIPRVRWQATLAAIGLIPLISTGCSPAADAQAGGEQDATVLARIDGQAITLDDLEALAGDQLASMEFQYRTQRHQVIENALEQFLRDRLIEEAARDRGLTSDELIEETVAGRLEVTDDDVAAWHAANSSRLGGRTLEQLTAPIRELLTDQAREAAIEELADDLSEARDVVLLLEPLRASLDTAGAPSIGSEQAPITLVEFSDFECPYCGRFFDTIERVKERYGDQLRIVFLQFPLEDIHPDAMKAAEASLCAQEQGSFWEMHDLMFQEQNQLGVAALKEKAARLGLDGEAFDACLDSGRFVEQVREDLQAGGRVGVSGTPAVFINGIPVPGGAIPFEELSAILDEELERGGR